jgi:hypothetical protein
VVLGAAQHFFTGCKPGSAKARRHPQFLPAVGVSTTNLQQLPAPPVPRSRCID